MSNYSTGILDSLGQRLTSFRGEEAYITFYLESSYTPGKKRSDMVPVGSYLYATGVTIADSVSELTPYQGFGSATKNITAPACQEASLTVNALYTQEGSSVSWMDPGHPHLIAFIDFIDSTKTRKSPNDVLNENLDYVQTIVVRDLRRSSRNITSNNGSSVAYSLSFTGGAVVTLAVGQMDLP